jgi:hypothetical protein
MLPVDYYISSLSIEKARAFKYENFPSGEMS